VARVEGEKTADATQRLLPSMVATTWPGGSNAYRHVDFTPLRGRKVVCVPDADEPGHNAFHGRQDRRRRHIPGILELLAEVGALTRIVEPEPTRPDGWDLADAEAEGWGAADTMAWLKSRLAEARDAA
jgi:putative DNA primase/helicase